MSDDSDPDSLFRSLRSYAREYFNSKRRALANPNTRVDSGGRVDSYTFQGQSIDHSELRDVKEIRESGGLVAKLVHTKALMNFGTGVEFHVEGDEETERPVNGEPMTLSEWLEDTFNDLDTILLDVGEDSIWYPYGAVELTETRGGDFGGVVPVEPWTIVPETNQYGEIQQWIQETTNNGVRNKSTFDADEIKHFVVNKASARDETGISEVLRSEEEITQYKENQRAMRNAIEMHGFPEWHIAAGREGAAPLDDNELRRIVSLFEDRRSQGDTVTATGPDVELNRLDPGDIMLEEVTSNDLQQLAISLGVPIEAVDFGSEGLGSGEQSKLRRAMLEIDIKATQRTYANQWVTEVIRPVIEEYSPYDHTRNLELVFDDPLTSNTDMASLIQSVGEYFETNEARERLDLPAKEELDGEFGPPTDEQEPAGGGPGLFSERRSLAVPDSAVPIDDRSEAPEGAQIVTGDRGGLYYIPKGEGNSTDEGGVEEQAQQIDSIVSSDQADWKKRDELQDFVTEQTPIDSARFDNFTPEQAATASKSFVKLDEADQLENISGVVSSLSESTKEASGGTAAHAYKPRRKTIELSPEYLSEEQAQEWFEENHLAGDSVDHMVAHEVGHHQHYEQDRSGDFDMSDAADYDMTPQEKNMVETELSTYAATSVGEFIAEAYAVKASGEELSPPLEDMYQEFGGVDPV